MSSQDLINGGREGNEDVEQNDQEECVMKSEPDDDCARNNQDDIKIENELPITNKDFVRQNEVTGKSDEEEGDKIETKADFVEYDKPPQICLYVVYVAGSEKVIQNLLANFVFEKRNRQCY